MNPIDQTELDALVQNRRFCRAEWNDGLEKAIASGPFPTVVQYERLEGLLASLKVSQLRLDAFHREH